MMAPLAAAPLPRSDQSFIQLWATQRAAELMRSEGEGQGRARFNWAGQIIEGDSKSPEPYTVSCPGELFLLHMRPQSRVALFYTASLAQILGAKSELSPLAGPLFRKLLTRCCELGEQKLSPE